MQQTKDKLISREEFRDVILPHMDEIYAAAVRLTQDENEAEFLAEETFAKAWRLYYQFEAGTNIRTWLYRILINDYYRHRKKYSLRSKSNIIDTAPKYNFSIFNKLAERLPHHQEKSIEALMGLFSEQDILKILRELPEGLRETVILSDFQNLPYEEIAELLNISIEFVRFQLVMGRHFFQKELWGKVGAKAPVVNGTSNLMSTSIGFKQARTNEPV